MDKVSTARILINGSYYTLQELTIPISCQYIWVAYQKKPPHLPIAVADSASELARLLGVTQNSIESRWYKYRHGKAPTSPYHRVKI